MLEMNKVFLSFILSSFFFIFILLIWFPSLWFFSVSPFLYRRRRLIYLGFLWPSHFFFGFLVISVLISLFLYRESSLIYLGFLWPRESEHVSLPSGTNSHTYLVTHGSMWSTRLLPVFWPLPGLCYWKPLKTSPLWKG